MPSILRNDDAEALILDIRSARQAATQRIGRAPGEFLAFPTAVVTSRPGGGQLVFPIQLDVEPGTLAERDGTATVSGVVGGIEVSGVFGWVLGDHGDPPPARYRFRRRGRDHAVPPWADQLPPSQRLVAQPPANLVRRQRRLLRQGRAAEHWLLTLTERVMRHSCRGPIRRAIQYRPQVDVDDVVQRGMQTACRLLPIYASENRPPCSWLGMLKLDGRRDMHREVSRLDWLPTDSAPPVYLDSLPDAPVEMSCQPTPAWSAFDDHPGTTQAVAQLVSDDPELIGLAAEGEARALRAVGNQVVSALGRGSEGRRPTRQRCWEEFERSGQLFATASGVERFSSLASPTSLAAIDESLRRAIGLSTATTPR